MSCKARTLSNDYRKMLAIRNTMEQIADNGYMVIPGIAGEKDTRYKWGSVFRNNYNFLQTFKSEPLDCNCSILCEDDVTVVDLDCHEREPNGRTIFDNLEEEVYRDASLKNPVQVTEFTFGIRD